jgi:hypothetical protein
LALNGGIRWLALNGGIRWVSLNERKKVVNEKEKEKEDMRGKTLERGGLFRRSIIFIWERVLGIFTSGEIGRLDYWFLAGEVHCRTEIGDTCCWEFWARGLGILTESWS